ncbi:hypothetical protein MPSEU_000040900 [Mayamaea pseudoterrestris]|nr:hypothetical protein MPSEU_000040900 [Mayamaea pseudoterrestris]
MKVLPVQRRKTASLRQSSLLLCLFALVTLRFWKAFKQTSNQALALLITSTSNVTATDERKDVWIEDGASSINSSSRSKGGKQKSSSNLRTNHTTAFASTFPSASPSSTEHQRIFYSQLRTDRSGAVIQDLLMAHAYAFENDLKYGGACDENIMLNETEQGSVRNKNSSVANIQHLIQSLGLQNDISLACPTSNAKAPIVHRNFYTSSGMAVFTKRWLDYIHSKVHYSQSNNKHSNTNQSDHQQLLTPTTKRAVIHMRRGDVQPCDDEEQRYLPHAYYLRAMLDHVPIDYQVTIHSESQSFEPWNDFMNQTNSWNVSYIFDCPILDAWIDMMNADVLILSKSSFSLVPALLNQHGRVIYTNFWYEPLPDWYETKINYQADLYEVKRRYCRSYQIVE